MSILDLMENYRFEIVLLMVMRRISLKKKEIVQLSACILACPKFISPAPTIFEQRNDAQWAVRRNLFSHCIFTLPLFQGTIQSSNRSVYRRTSRANLHSRCSKVIKTKFKSFFFLEPMVFNFSYLKLYTTMNIDKLATFMEKV